VTINTPKSQLPAELSPLANNNAKCHCSNFILILLPIFRSFTWRITKV
jgi:hypothetical protein